MILMDSSSIVTPSFAGEVLRVMLVLVVMVAEAAETGFIFNIERNKKHTIESPSVAIWFIFMCTLKTLLMYDL